MASDTTTTTYSDGAQTTATTTTKAPGAIKTTDNTETTNATIGAALDMDRSTETVQKGTRPRYNHEHRNQREAVHEHGHSQGTTKSP